MGFSEDVSPISVSDFTKYGYEAQTDHLQLDSTDFSELLKGVINEHIAYLRYKGYSDPSLITNDTDHYPLLVAMALEKIYRSRGGGAGFDEEIEWWGNRIAKLREVLVVITAASGTQTSRGLPMSVNVDGGFRHVAPGYDVGHQIGRGTALPRAVYDSRIKDGK